MEGRPKFDEVLERVMALTYPPTTLSIVPGKAMGHRLAKPVVARGNQPSRPVALVDGLAVMAADVNLGKRSKYPRHDEYDEETELAQGEEPKPQKFDGLNLTHHRATRDEPADEEEPVEQSETVLLELRPFPKTNRREDALQSGQAIAVSAGGEVPRGGDLIIPLSELAGEPEEQEVLVAPTPPPAPAKQTRRSNDVSPEEEENELPVAEPARAWDLPARFQQGQVEIRRRKVEVGAGMISIGSWARNRQVLIPEKTVLRSGDIAMLDALNIDSVEIYRRPVVGVASLAQPFPEAGRQLERSQQEGACPLMRLASTLSRAARVAALPLGFAPLSFRQSTHRVNHWINQVDVLLLVGGTHHGTQGLGRDLITSLGEIRVDGMDLTPGGNLSAGMVRSKPVIAMPGSLADVLVGFIALVRPLTHKYLLPHHFTGEIPLALDHGSRLKVDQDTAVPVRYSFDRERDLSFTRYSGRPSAEWLDFIRGQALIKLEAGRDYQDGEIVSAHTY